MKFILILLANFLFILYCIFYLVDHTFTRASVEGKIKQILLIGFGLFVVYNLLFIYVLKKEKEETGLLYKMISFGERHVHAAMTFIQPIQKELIISIIVAIVLATLGMILSGLPGAAVLRLFQKVGLLTAVKGDNVWPTAILLSILLPLCFPIAVLARHYIAQQGYAGFKGFGGLIACSWMLLWIFIIHLFVRAKS